MDNSNDEKKLPVKKTEKDDLNKASDEKKQPEYQLDDEEMNMDLINAGAQEVVKEGGYDKSLEEAISRGLISAIEKLIESGMIKKLVNEINGKTDKKEEKGWIEKVLDIIINLVTGYKNEIKELNSQLEEANTLINNQNTKIEGLTNENSTLKGENEKLKTQMKAFSMLLKQISEQMDKLTEVKTDIQENQNDKVVKTVEAEQSFMTIN
jgi:hypothetical protein